MMARTHMAIGFLVGLISLPLMKPENGVLFLALIVFSSILPDIDHKGSTINRIFPVTKITAVFFKHRGFFHSGFPIVGILVGTSIIGFINIGIPLAIGYGSHLVSDGFTRMGVNFLHPISKFVLKGPVITGGWMEHGVFILALIGIVVVLL